MTINTKFNVGDELFFLQDSSIQKSPVTKITIECNNDSPLVIYFFKGNQTLSIDIYKYENEVALTIHELINQLSPK